MPPPPLSYISGSAPATCILLSMLSIINFSTHWALFSDSLFDVAGVGVGAIFAHVLSVQLVNKDFLLCTWGLLKHEDGIV